MITGKNNEIIKNTAKLVKSHKYRKECGLFTAEGIRICRDGVVSGYTPEIFFYTEKSKDKYFSEYEEISAVSKKNILVSQDVFEKISDTKSPQGFLCVYNVLDKCRIPYTINNQGNYLALENLQDPSNLGTILRKGYVSEPEEDLALMESIKKEDVLEIASSMKLAVVERVTGEAENA